MALSKCPGSNAMGGSELGEDDLLCVWCIFTIQVGQRSLLGRAGQEAWRNWGKTIYACILTTCIVLSQKELFQGISNTGFDNGTQKQTLPKAQRTRGFSSYHKFLHTSWSNSESRLSIYSTISNLNLKSWPNLAWLSFKILTTIQLHNLNQTSAKYWSNISFKSRLSFNFKILTKPCAQSLNKSLALWPNLSS